MIFGSFAILADAEALDNPVVPNGKLGEFGHGTFPSLGERTHVGVDIVASCGSDIYAFADGRVKDVISNKNDKIFKALGYMVLIEHPVSVIGKMFYTLYLHMQKPPKVKVGDQVKGGNTVIGKVGDTGEKTQGCNTHFEIRYFPERLSKWGDIYGPGDQRASEYFKQNWEDPIAFFEKYPTGITLNKSVNDPGNRDISKTKSKGVPVYVDDLVFKKSKFSEPITMMIPSENSPGDCESAIRAEQEADRKRGLVPAIIIHTSLRRAGDFGADVGFLIKHGYARIEECIITTKRWYKPETSKYHILYYTDKIRAYILSHTGTTERYTEIVIAHRKLKSIDYKNQYEGTLLETGAKTQFYALTFSYVLEEKLPRLPEINKVFQGKAKAYLDPDDGQWKLWHDGIELEDSGSSEYTELIKQQYKESKTEQESKLKSIEEPTFPIKKEEELPHQIDKQRIIQDRATAQLAYKSKDYGKAFQLYKSLAEQGDADSEYTLGTLYLEGQGVEKNEGEAVKWIQKATLDGSADAQYHLGLMYKLGAAGLPRDRAKAKENFEKAAAQGHFKAKEQLRRFF